MVPFGRPYIAAAERPIVNKCVRHCHKSAPRCKFCARQPILQNTTVSRPRFGGAAPTVRLL
eukprot:15468230-Alexandrium_andersonii.AAC.1